jgi:hypothetical protein
MLASDHHRIKLESNQQGIIFSFNGFISEGILFALGDALKRKMSQDETNPGREVHGQEMAASHPRG